MKSWKVAGAMMITAGVLGGCVQLRQIEQIQDQTFANCKLLNKDSETCKGYAFVSFGECEDLECHTNVYNQVRKMLIDDCKNDEACLKRVPEKK
jgi:hypothetical protein